VPRQVVPEYGILIESTPSSAVPVSAMLHVPMIGTDVARASAVHEITSPESVARAEPSIRRSLAHVALKVPAALVAVRSVTFQLKFPHESRDGN
jgi:hypothetical protein